MTGMDRAPERDRSEADGAGAGAGSAYAWLVHDGPALADAALVGNKFARQAVLREHGFPVPGFFCVPATVFDLVVPVTSPADEDGTRLSDADPEGISAWAATARERVESAGVPAGLDTALLDAFDRLVGPDGMAAVRACVVPNADGTGEDGADDPFAGLSDSFLYVGRDDLLRRTAACWASAFNAGALAYRLHRGLDPRAARVAVGVQRMVLGTRSFVAFSKDPRDGRDRCVIAAAYGIGEGVVQEKADVDHFFVDSATADVEARVVPKHRMVGLDPAEPRLGAVALDVPARLAGQPVLDDEDARRIAALAADVEARLGGAQDIEGTIDEDGVVHLLQARPAMASEPAGPTASATTPTAIPDANATPDATDAAGSGVPWSNHNITESFPGVTCALTFSLAVRFYETAFRDTYRRMGVSAEELRRNGHHLKRMIGSVDGRVYCRLDAWYHLHGQVPGFDVIQGSWERAVGHRKSAHNAQVDEVREHAAARGLRSVPGLLVRIARHRGAVHAFRDWWERTAERYSDPALDALSPDQLIATYRYVWAEVDERWGITLVNGFFLTAATGAAGALLRRWAPESGQELFNGLLCGGPENLSAKAVRSAIALAERVRSDDRLCEAVLDGDERQVWKAVTSGDYGQDVADAAARHVHAYGDRGLHDLKLEVVTIRQEPWTLLRVLRPFIRQELTTTASLTEEHRIREEAEAELRRNGRGPVRRGALAALFGALRRLMRFREDARFYRSQLIGFSRGVLLRLGAALADAGRLDAPSDVFDLTVEEVIGAFDGTLPGTDLRGLARVRGDDRRGMLERPGLPGRFDAPAGTPLANAVTELRRTGAERPDGGPSVLTGLASSSGRVRARAKVVLDPAVDPQTCEGRILIARETDPGWMFLMLAAKGLVVERGTILSHTAITGRVLGVPTVVAVEDATSLIPDGAWIEVDGRAGTVRLLGADEVNGGELPHAGADIGTNADAETGADTETAGGADTDGTTEEGTAC